MPVVTSSSYFPDVVLDKDTLDEVVEAYKRFDYFIFDVETLGTRDKRSTNDKPATDERTNQVIWIALAGPGRSDIIPMGHPDVNGQKSPTQLRRSYALDKLKPIFFSPEIRKVNQKVQFDLLTLSKYWGAMPPGPFADLITLYHVWNPTLRAGGFSLGNMSKIYLGFNYRKLAREGAIDKFPFWDVAQYVGLDAQVTHLLWLLMRPHVEKREKSERIFEMEEELTEVVCHMKQNGILVDKEGMEALGVVLEQQVRAARTKTISYVPGEWESPNSNKKFNPDSVPHLRKLLFVDFGLKSLKQTPKGQASTDKYVLDLLRLSHPIIDEIKNLRELTKLNSTYVVGTLQRIDDDNRLRANWNQCGTETGRFSCSGGFNLQNLPSANDPSATEGQKIRHMFMASPGYVIIGADYKQIEGRLMGHLCAASGAGTAMRNLFVDPDVDWHRATASKMYHVPMSEVTDKQRAKGKTCNFGLLYGGYWTLLVAKFKIPPREAERMYNMFHKVYPELMEYTKIVCAKARSKPRPYTETIWGRRRYFPDINIHVYGDGEVRITRWKKRIAAEREAVNHTIQGSSADLTKSAMVRWWRRTERLGVRDSWHLLVTEHDALYVEVPEKDVELGKSVLQEAMCGVKMDLSVPFPIDMKVGQRWSEVK